MQSTDPDHLVQRLWRLRERLSSPVSSVPYFTTGGVWADACANCHATRHHRAESGIERCSRCGSPWHEVEGRVPKGKRPKGSGNPMTRRYDELSFCVTMLGAVEEPARTLYEQHLSPIRGGMDYALAVARATLPPEYIARLPDTEYGYRKNIARARDIVRLELMAHRARALMGA